SLLLGELYAKLYAVGLAVHKGSTRESQATWRFASSDGKGLKVRLRSLWNADCRTRMAGF
ncbi:MAG: hypothetical protein KDK99_14290, partial [Verrucomicrobiales bacterium]|nr:hypothetical protein [Verrucomicrobiales bacterium]